VELYLQSHFIRVLGVVLSQAQGTYGVQGSAESIQLLKLHENSLTCVRVRNRMATTFNSFL
jgi:hypothetical protein